MRRTLWFSVVTVFLPWLGLVQAQDSNYFINPSGPDLSSEKNYTVGQSIRFQWNSNYRSQTLCMTQYDHDDQCQRLLQDESSGPSPCFVTVNTTREYACVWVVNTTSDFISNPRFHLVLINADNSSLYFWSPGFFIWPRAAIASPPSTSTSSTSTSTSSTSLVTPTAPVTTSPSSTPSAGGGNNGNGLSTGAKAGIGVAVPLAFLSGCGLMFFLLRRRNKPQIPTASPYDPSVAYTDERVELDQPKTSSPHAYQLDQHPISQTSMIQKPQNPHELQGQEHSVEIG
ncbi:MAG: hypothetical protein M1816_000685 [Peltula sp. TS41687]|nr:MAG: hypothetical protein M1816_000685 [Peltula sp. TS41687]